MADLGPNDLKDPKVRSALEWLRVATAIALIALIGWLVIDREHGGFEYVVLLIGSLGAVLGLPLLAQLIKKG